MTKKLKNKKGFTLMEMLIVVGIIAILVAIAIPTFSSALTKARVATDKANVRAYYAELAMDYLLEGTAPTTTTTALTTINVAGEDVDLTQGEVTIAQASGVYTITYTSGSDSQAWTIES